MVTMDWLNIFPHATLNNLLAPIFFTIILSYYLLIKLDDVQVKENLTYKTFPLRIEDRRTKQLRGKEISLVKVIWGGASGEDTTWELENQMQESYPTLFESGKFWG